MERIEKGLQILMFAVVALMVIVFFASIMIGHATNYEFLFSFQDVSELSNTLVNNNIIL